MLASSEERETAGSKDYQDRHFGAILKEGFSFSGHERDNVHLNRGGARYLNISGLTGIDSDTDGRAAVYADFDNDGDYDIFRTAFQGQAHHLFKNRIGQEAGFVRVALEGRASGRDAYGAVVRVRTSQGTLTKIKSGGAGFVSHHDPRLLFGLGEDLAAEWIEVRWPSGRVDRVDDVPTGSSLALLEGEGVFRPVDETRFELPEPQSAASAFRTLLAAREGDRFPDLAVDVVAGVGDGPGASGRDVPLLGRLSPGRLTLVNVWATWCAPCKREMPELEKLAAGWKARGLDVVGLNVDLARHRSRLRPELRKMGITYPIFAADEHVFPALFTGERIVVPLNYVLDGTGTVLDVFGGWTDEAKRGIEARLK